MDSLESTKIIRKSPEGAYMDLVARVREIGQRTRYLDNGIKLPVWGNDVRGVPNSLLRSALFSAIQSKDREYYRDKEIHSLNEIKIIYTGHQLNQEDLLVWETILHLLREKYIGAEFEITSNNLLGVMGMGVSAQSYKTLNDCMTRLTFGALKVEFGDFRYYGSLINAYVINNKTTVYDVSLNPKLINLYDVNHWTAMQWASQKLIKRKPLAQFLYNFYSTHEVPYAYTVEKMMELSGSKTKTVRTFKQKLKQALDELIKQGFLLEYSIIDGLVSVKRKKLSTMVNV